MKRREIKIGTRGSKLALWQATWVAQQLGLLADATDIQICKIKTTGDKITDVALSKVGGKGLFVKEIEDALLKRQIDIAVHSMKDVPSELPQGLHLPAICKREDVRDAVVFRRDDKDKKPLYKSLYELPKGASVGTSSLRRACQLLNIRDDISIKQLRGNVDTRLKKLQDGLYDAVILASAGLMRLGFADRIDQLFAPTEMIPAVGQGAIGVECRLDDIFINDLVSKLNHEQTSLCVRAERSFLKRLEGGCQVPIGAHAVIDGTDIRIIGFIGSIDGKIMVKDEAVGSKDMPESIGISLADLLLKKGGKEILDEVYG
ncbi:MAG: hydroxymethylbilane synthase [Thermodesulfovibrionales bacterium]|nr:hydroxymethylbilane synthase [Thermodesulfovibrionales bacterium]